MREIRIENVHVVASDTGLTLSREGEPATEIRFDAKGVQELIRFITSAAEIGFNRRRSFRVSLWDSCELSVQVKRDGDWIAVVPKNISVTGILIEVPPEALLELACEQFVQIMLTLDDETISVSGIVQRCTKNIYGVLFPNSIRGDQIEPPAGLNRLVKKLERRWIARRRRRL